MFPPGGGRLRGRGRKGEGEGKGGGGIGVIKYVKLILIFTFMLFPRTHLCPVPATIPTNLKATLLSSTSNTQTFIFTWEVNPETASDDLLGFILRCHGSSDSSPPGGMSASGIYFENSSQSATPPRSLTVTMATSCSELTCHVAPFNGAGEGVASSGVTLPSSCPEGIVTWLLNSIKSHYVPYMMM